MTDTLSWLAALYQRDLAALSRQVEAYPDDAAPRQEVPGLTNPGGTLILHLAGNLQHFVGAKLGRTGYVRDRPAEFSRRGLPRAELVAVVNAARDAVGRTLASLDPSALSAPFPEPLVGHQFTTGDLLLHLAVHLGYHLGQVDYHRRAVTASAVTVGAMALPELASARPV
jgi:hypothetical protein